MRFEFEDLSLVSRLIWGQYPHFDRIIPKECQKRLVLNTQGFLAAVRRAASVFSRGSTNRVVLKTGEEGLLDITAEVGEVGCAHEQIEVSLEGEPVETAFNGRYLLDALHAIETETVALELTGALNPGVLKPVWPEEQAGRTYLHVLMPMSVDGRL